MRGIVWILSYVLSFWRGMILKLLLLGVLVDRLVALDAVEVVGCCIVFRESWGVLLASRRSPIRWTYIRVAGLGCF